MYEIEEYWKALKSVLNGFRAKKNSKSLLKLLLE